ncbi:MAG: ribosome maturation factor RimM [Alphaproteobacteria bacterium]|jgi:16S rRNA processing protein RimM|tara:strand:+ start:86 stop:574 length:489 start_codon:yes stop_codon:yes gene_type:complete
MNSSICIGKITSAHGVKGNILVESYTDDPKSILSYKTQTILSSKVSVKILNRKNKNLFIAQVKDIENRDQAEALNGELIYIDRLELVNLPSDEFYSADLINLDIYNLDLEKLGKVIMVHNYGAGDLIEIQKNDLSTTIILFTKDNFPEIDLKSKKIYISNIE